ncbi:hypothetical protein ABZX40_13235 [Streptomyces sp. NPDC004610]|uniref:hypothetical protein n=1 Tax=unclassified Streptomyces TaxID=2593676 RepID=UPI0033BD645E
MGDLPAAVVAGAVIVALLLVAYRRVLRWERRHESPHARVVRQTHERAETARRQDPVTLAAGPEWQAGRDRLHTAVHSEPDGDQ